jgi:hypothetical protein
MDKSTPYKTYRWTATGVIFLMFGLRIFFAQGWYIGMLLPRAVSSHQLS